MERFYETDDLEKAIFGTESDEREEEWTGGTFKEDVELPALELELVLEDGNTMLCIARGVFLAGEKQYIALQPKEDTEGKVHILELTEGENDEAKLLPVEDEEEFKAAAKAFYHMIGEEQGEWQEAPADEDAVRKEEIENDRD